jgi:glutamate--cysteine ligase
MSTATAELPHTESLILPQLKALADARGAEMEAWLAARAEESRAPFYSSVDVRHAGFKIAPVDTNLFPAGFNHLSAAARLRAAERVKARIARCAPTTRVLVIPENHTRNQGYIDNLAALRDVLTLAGLDVAFGSLAATDAPVEVTTSAGVVIRQMPILHQGNMLSTADGFTPQLVLLNNDLTSGFPELLRGVSQPILPRPNLGWYRRRKSGHFAAYAALVGDFARSFDLDPWLLSAEFHQCGQVNFGEKQGLDCVALGVEKVLYKIRAHYARYGIADEPYVYVKSDSGTYGMGIMTVRSGDEVLEINKKARNKMNVIKEGVQSTQVIIQEGVPTADVIDGAPAEPMVYLIDGHAVGGAFRVNDQRDAMNNLNAAGMRFVGMCDESESLRDGHISMPSCNFGGMGLIARLASLAAAREE